MQVKKMPDVDRKIKTDKMNEKLTKFLKKGAHLSLKNLHFSLTEYGTNKYRTTKIILEDATSRKIIPETILKQR